MKYNEQSEKNIIKAFELLEQGTAVSDILNLFPEQKEELQELFQTMETVQSAKNNIRPSEELLSKIISDIPDERIEHQENHAPSFGFSAWFKFAVPTTAMAIILIAVFYSKLLPEEPQNIVQKSANQTATPAVVLPANTSIADNKKNEKTFSPAPKSAVAANNIDDLINEAIALADNQQLIQDEDADASFINSDDQVFDDFSQFYDEKEL